MSPSRPFIMRPVATSLLMAAILLAGIVAFRFLSLSALPEESITPTIPKVQTFYPGGRPRGDGDHHHRPAGSPVRPNVRPEPDVVDQLGRLVGDHLAVQPGSWPRRRRTRRSRPRSTAAGSLLSTDLPGARRSTPRSIQPMRRSSPWPSPPRRCPSPTWRRWPISSWPRRSRRWAASAWSRSAVVNAPPCASRSTPTSLPPTALPWLS